MPVATNAKTDRQTLKPRIFIGSSTESLEVVETVARGLKNEAIVIPWNNELVFSAGDFVLNSLLKQARQFDFALMIFGPDDIVISRRQRQPAPRDNVIFELGLFMSHLEPNRALVLAPRGSKDRIRILSDLAGLNLINYVPPTKRNDPIALAQALRGAIKQIRKRIKERGLSPVVELPSYEGPRDVTEVSSEIRELLETAREKNQPVNVQNIALDMEVTWRIIHDSVLANSAARDVTWHSLMIDPESTVIRNAASSTVSVRTAQLKIKEIRESCTMLRNEFRDRNVRFECRAYNSIPVIHGFLVNKSVLLLTLTGIEDGRLVGAPNPYWRLLRTSTRKPITHLFDAYSEWFRHLWRDSSRPIWPD